MKTKKKKEGEQKSRREAQYMPLAFRACRSDISIWKAPNLPGLLSSRNIAIQQALFQMVCGTKPASREERRRERWRKRRERRGEQASAFRKLIPEIRVDGKVWLLGPERAPFSSLVFASCACPAGSTRRSYNLKAFVTEDAIDHDICSARRQSYQEKMVRRHRVCL